MPRPPLSSDVVKRERTLRSLLELDRPLQSILQDLASMTWDADKELVTLRPEHVIALLKRHETGALNADEVEEWANALEGREDIALHPESQTLLEAVLFDLANPVLQGPLTRDAVQHWLERLSVAPGRGEPEPG